MPSDDLVSLDGLRMCRACMNGEGEMCHEPECICCRHAVDIPFLMVQLSDEHPRDVPDAEALRAALHLCVDALDRLMGDSDVDGDDSLGFRAMQAASLALRSPTHTPKGGRHAPDRRQAARLDRDEQGVSPGAQPEATVSGSPIETGVAPPENGAPT